MSAAIAPGQLRQHRVVGGQVGVVVAFGGPVHAHRIAPVAALPLNKQGQQHYHQWQLAGRPGDGTAELLIAEKVCVPRQLK